MAELVPPPTRRPPTDAPADVARTLDTLATAVMILVTVGILYFAREILIPVAIAVILSFVLSPLIKLLRRFGLGKKLAVGLAVLLTFIVAVGLGAILAKQVSDLAGDASRYQETVSHKVEGLRSFAANNPLLAKLNSLIADMDQTAPAKTEKPKPAVFPPRSEAHKPAPMPVEVVQPPPGVISLLQTAAGLVATPLATAAFVAIFIVFILMQREDLRNRLIRLAGSGDLQRTTLALNDAARRLSRYFLAQVLLNAGFGVITAVALSIIGVPGAILWGIVATFMRFIPYIGSLGSALFPVLLALAASPGWTMASETAVFFAVLEFIVGQVVEPLVYGHNTGISPFAVVLSATFWTWLWGPVGLVLATPMTVCVVVMGRHVERLSFLDVLLGDAPPLTDIESFYQRMLSGDASEVFDHADTYLAEHSLLNYCDTIAMKALLLAQDDVRRGALSEERQMRILDTMRDLAEDLADRGDTILPVDASGAPAALDAPTEDEAAADHDLEDDLPKQVTLDSAWTADDAVLCVAGRTPLDEAAAYLLADLLKQRGFGARVEPASSLVDAGGGGLDGRAPRLVILSFLDADLSLAQARFAVRRLRRRLPAPRAPACGRAADDRGRVSGLCHDVRADLCISSLVEAIRTCLERGAAQADASTGVDDSLQGDTVATSQRSTEYSNSNV